MTSAKQRRLAAFAATDRSHTGRHNDWVRMVPFARYDLQTGAILEAGQMPVAALDRIEAEKGWRYLRRAADPALHFVDVAADPPRRRARSSCPARLEGTTLRSLPVPCIVTVTDPAGERTVIDCDVDALALSFEFPGTYRLNVASVPYTDGEFELEVGQ